WLEFFSKILAWGPCGPPGCAKATSLLASSVRRGCTRLAGGDATRPYQGTLPASAVGTKDGPNWSQSTALGLADVRARSLAIPGSIFLEDLLQYSQLPWKIDVLLLFS